MKVELTQEDALAQKFDIECNYKRDAACKTCKGTKVKPGHTSICWLCGGAEQVYGNLEFEGEK